MGVAHIAWARSVKTGSSSRKAVLVALADHCNDHTLRCDPNLSMIADETELSVTTVKRAAKELVELGLIGRKRRRRGDGSLSVYEFTFPQVQTTSVGQPGVTVTPRPPQMTRDHGGTAEPEEDQTLEPEVAAAPARPRERNPIWDALTELFGEASTETAKSLRGKIVRSLKAADATAEQIRAAPDLWRKKMPPDATFTEAALEKHWGFLLLAQRQRPAPACPECGVGGGHHAEDCQRARQEVTGGTRSDS